MNRWTPFLAAALVLACAPAAHAQAADSAARPNALERGARALSFSLPQARSATFGFWKMRSDRSALGVEANVRAARQSQHVDSAGDLHSSIVGADLGVSLRRYARTDRRVAPFAQVGVSAGASRTAFGADSLPSGARVKTFQAGVDTGVGAEWFPFREVSVAGWTGATLNVQHATSTRPLAGASQNIFVLGTFTSSLSLQVYF